MNSNKEFAKSTAIELLKIKAVKLQPQTPFTWASGIVSPIYCDNRKCNGYPEVRNMIKNAFVGIVCQEFGGADVIAGVATAGISWGILVADILNKPFIYIRSAPKDHGLENLIEGELQSGQKVVVIEDLISTGGSSLKAVEAIRKAGGEVLGMAAIFTYQLEEAAQRFALSDCKLFTLSNYTALLDVAVEQEYVSESDLKNLSEWRKSPRTWGK